jgi:hypothetical protein
MYGSTHKRASYRHPVHLNSSLSSPDGSWYGGHDYDHQGQPIIRETEWDVQDEGKHTNLAINFEDWVRTMYGFPCEKSDLRVLGGNRKSLNAYFYIAIAIENPNGPQNGTCPYLFGPRSVIFSIRPQNNLSSDAGSGFFREWCFHIGN